MEEIDAVKIIFAEGWNRENFEPLGEALAPEFTFHVRGMTRQMDAAALRDIIRRWRVGFPDLHFEIRAVVATGENAALHATLTGTHRGAWSGLEPTGRSIDVEHMYFFRFEEGRVAEVWELLDRPALERQLAGEA